MRRLPSRSEVTIRSAPSARTRRGRVGGGNADERAALLGIAWRRDYSAQLVDPGDQALVQRGHVGPGLGDPDLRDQLDPGDARVDRRDRRRARLEPARRRRGRVVVDVHLEDVPVGEPAGLGGEKPLGELAAAPEEPEPGGGEQVLQRARAEEVHAERADVDRVGADRLVGIEQHERPTGVRELDDLLDRQPCAVPVADRRDRDERRSLVDQLVEPLDAGSRRPPGARGRSRRRAAPGHARSGPTVGNSKSETTTRGRSLQSKVLASELTPGRERGRHRHLVGLAADEPREGGACRLGPLDPVLPRCALLVPVGQVGVVGRAHRVRERALRAGVEVGEPLEDREPRAAPGDRAPRRQRPR